MEEFGRILIDGQIINLNKVDLKKLEEIEEKIEKKEIEIRNNINNNLEKLLIK